MAKNKILLVGAGELGSRHLQSLSKLSVEKFSINVVDPSEESLDLSRQRYQLVKDDSSPKVKYHNRLNDISEKKFDVCIVATNAEIRLFVIKELFSKIDIKYLLLEKVLFQSRKQLSEAANLLREVQTKTWVNCPRRQFSGYKELKKIVGKSKKIDFKVEGYNWGLACNSIHFIDLWAYLISEQDYSIAVVPKTEIIESKRQRFKELIGGIKVISCGKNHTLELISAVEKEMNIEISITADKDLFKILEVQGEIILFNSGKEVKESIPLEVRYQSELTHIFIEQVIKDGKSDLTSFEESYYLHYPLLEVLERFFREKDNNYQNLVPIT